jgi:hypothetical protein
MTLLHYAQGSTIVALSTLPEDVMRKPRDFDGELKALQDKARDLKSRKVQQLGELVIASGARRRSGGRADHAGRDEGHCKEGGMGKTWDRVLSEPGAANCTGS